MIEIECVIEAVLFAAGEAVPLPVIALAASVSEETALLAVRTLTEKYSEENRGIHIIEINGLYQMCTNPLYYGNAAALFQTPQKKQLSQTLIETLAIIVYKQPVTKAQVEAIRGVDASHAINRLVEYGVVCEKGRQDAPGRPILFGTTDEFLKLYGFNSLSALPEL